MRNFMLSGQYFYFCLQIFANILLHGLTGLFSKLSDLRNLIGHWHPKCITEEFADEFLPIYVNFLHQVTQLFRQFYIAINFYFLFKKCRTCTLLTKNKA